MITEAYFNEILNLYKLWNSELLFYGFTFMDTMLIMITLYVTHLYKCYSCVLRMLTVNNTLQQL